jgi:hypothetical protein
MHAKAMLAISVANLKNFSIENIYSKEKKERAVFSAIIV